MTRIALTGAAGNVGRELVAAVEDGDFDDHEVDAFTHSEHEDIESELLEVTDPDDVHEKLAGYDVVFHLAGASEPDTEWDLALETNVEGTKHVLDAAVEHDVDRVVFASSNHAVGTYNAADDDPEHMTLDHAEPVCGDAPPSPDSFYGVSKVACEGLTSFYANRHDLEIVNLRIGWYMTPDDLRDVVAEAEPERERFARATWLSPHDCRDVFLKSATADLPYSPVTVNAISQNSERYFTLTETMRTLGYEPLDDAAETLAE
ncbi:NAD-dependent epimerase/dehydratase family protein [Halomarina salina]|uniref:NAD-dependent epimerase/dehydratase family protein n=1 Tax=Halomarina salina TaxID=1872699 RepID=A0ABD5RNE9_9EURY|nr:NAD(P)-dependent oxidoreductase [Halomarina salina]